MHLPVFQKVKKKRTRSKQKKNNKRNSLLLKKIKQITNETNRFRFYMLILLNLHSNLFCCKLMQSKNVKFEQTNTKINKDYK